MCAESRSARTPLAERGRQLFGELRRVITPLHREWDLDLLEMALLLKSYSDWLLQVARDLEEEEAGDQVQEGVHHAGR
jgi:hypothetical protein